VGAVRCFF